jgi:hypothetical protein
MINVCRSCLGSGRRESRTWTEWFRFCLSTPAIMAGRDEIPEVERCQKCLGDGYSHPPGWPDQDAMNALRPAPPPWPPLGITYYDEMGCKRTRRFDHTRMPQ